MKHHIISRHTVEQAVACEYGCGALLPSRHALAYHHKQLHLPKEFKCPHKACKRVFFSFEELTTHITTVHPKERPAKTPTLREFDNIWALRIQINELHSLTKTLESELRSLTKKLEEEGLPEDIFTTPESERLRGFLSATKAA